MTILNIPLGCLGNKYKEYKKYLKDFILDFPINENTIFIEPFCGSSYISFNLWKEGIINNFHINDLDEFRIKFYKDIKNDNLEEIINIENEVIKGGSDVYYKYVNKNNKNDYISYILARRIHSFRYGLYPTNKKIKEDRRINENWVNFFKSVKITNKDWTEIMELYKDNENAIIYLDPPYLDSFNAYYNTYGINKNKDEENTKIDNTKIYVDIIDFLKNSKCKIIFSINSNSLTDYIYKDFIKKVYNNIYEMTKKKENILLITNR